ncbi:MAG: DUF3134 domain-containing protein, partial [Cyanobacteria bacterium J06659_2]
LSTIAQCLWPSPKLNLTPRDTELNFMAYNPSLRAIPRSEHAAVIPLQQNASILKWLEGTGRLIPREPVEVVKEVDEANNEEITDLMGGDDGYDDDDDDDVDVDDD